jgi:hypothetical protein
LAAGLLHGVLVLRHPQQKRAAAADISRRASGNTDKHHRPKQNRLDHDARLSRRAPGLKIFLFRGRRKVLDN